MIELIKAPEALKALEDYYRNRYDSHEETAEIVSFCLLGCMLLIGIIAVISKL